jgi:hypothetical protein
MVFGGSWRMVCQPALYRQHQKMITSSKMDCLSMVSFFEINPIP